MIKLLALFSLFFLIGCGTGGPHTVDLAGNAQNQMDVTIGNYEAGWGSRHVLITIEAVVHDALVEGRSIASVTNEHSDLPEKYHDFLEHMKTRYSLNRVTDWPLASLGIHCLVFEMGSDINAQELVKRLAEESLIESAQPMQEFNILSQIVYDDPYLPLQHGIRSMQIQSTHQWAKGTGVRVAIIDTGMELAHQDLTTNIAMSKNFVDKDEAAFSNDIHGTAVAGVIAASANNDAGMVGAAPDSRVIALKACWQDSKTNSHASCNTITLAKALNFSILNKAAVINMSLTGPRDRLLERLITTALANNIIVVGAVGASGVNMFPTATPGTIAVINSEERLHNTISAPGRKILSTVPENQYEIVNGSSFSAAHISGLAALLKELKPDLQPEAFLKLLHQTADNKTGAVNACHATAVLMQFDADTSCDVQM